MIKQINIGNFLSIYNFLLICQTQIIFVSTKHNNFNRDTYCQLDCGSLIHTLCEYSTPCIDTCRYSYEFHYLTNDQREFILKIHNQFRNRIASGKENGDLGQFAGIHALDMNILNWSKEAEYIASCMAKHCDPGNDKCKMLADGTDCGQNYYLQMPLKDQDLKKLFKETSIYEDIISKWYDNLRNYKTVYKEDYAAWENNSGRDFGPFTYGSDVMSFTQIVWATTKYIGCSYNIYRYWNADRVLLYCNYCPIGNVNGQPIFELGSENFTTICSKNANYTNLCGQEIPLDEDTFILDTSTIVYLHNIAIVVCAILNRIVA